MKRLRILIISLTSLLATATVAKADQIRALLTGYEETPAAVSTTGRGLFLATIDPDGDAINYSLTFNALQAAVTQAHIHVGQLSITGSIVIFLCQTPANPNPTGLAPWCPQQATVTGRATSAHVLLRSIPT